MASPHLLYASTLSQLALVNPKAAESIADPIDYPNLFDGLDHALKV